jgi:hypothetical protein
MPKEKFQTTPEAERRTIEREISIRLASIESSVKRIEKLMGQLKELY